MNQSNPQNDVKKILTSPFFNRYTRSLLGVGFDSRGEQSLAIVLVVASFMLTIASGYTTISGLVEYIWLPFAILIGLGVQGLLFAVSWRIGTVTLSEHFPKSLFIIYIITMTISVFFSYTALFGVIYTDNQRKNENLNNAISDGLEIISSYTQKLEEAIKPKGDSLISEIHNWKNLFFHHTHTISQETIINYGERKAIWQGKQRKAEEELERGYGADSPGSGDGKRYRKFKKEEEEYYNKNFAFLDQAASSLLSSKKRFEEKFAILTLSYKNLSLNNLNSFIQAADNYSTIVRTYGNASLDTIPPFPTDLLNKIILISSDMAFFSSDISIINIDLAPSVQAVQDSLKRFSRQLPKTISNTQELLEKINSISLFSGEDVHIFVVSIGNLLRLNPLSILVLFLALFVDLLILFCGLLGSRPDSFLKMKTIDSLKESQEKALIVLLSLDLDSPLPKNPFIKRVLEIIKAIEPDIESLNEGISGIIKKSEIEKLNLVVELGILERLNLIIPLNLETEEKSNVENDHAQNNSEEYIGVTPRLILWLSEQVYNFRMAADTHKDFNTTLKDSLNSDKTKKE